MAKKNKNTADLPAGMSRRQAKLAARAAERAALTVDPRPFHTTGIECDLIAMREFVASAAFDITIDGETVRICTILPGAVAAHRLEEQFGGLRMVGVQSAQPSNHPADLHPHIDVYDDFNWWVPDTSTLDPQTAQSIRAANKAMMISRRLLAPTGAAWWVDTREKGHVRWVRPESEDDMFTALARLHAAHQLALGEGSRYAGMFRVYGLLVPVFDVDRTQPADHWQAALDTLGDNMEKALAATTPLTDAERNSRNLLNSRQVTIR